MKYTYILYIMYALAAMTLCGCEVHQWPELSDTPEPTPDYPKVTIPLRLEYDTDFYIWEHKYDPIYGTVEEVNPSLNIFPDYPGTSSKYSNIAPTGLLQVYVRVYPASDASKCVAEHMFTQEINGSYDTNIDLEVEGYSSYDIVVWTQLLESSQSLPFYDPTIFSQIHIITANYRGNTDYRDGFRGRLRVDVTEDSNERRIVNMHRPMGKFELVTTDLSEFLDRETEVRRLTTRASAEDYRVVISFPMYYPSSYSAMDDRLENAYTGMYFETQMTVTGDSEASLGFEYVMLGNYSDNGVQTRVDIYRLDGTQVAGSSMFTIPMRRDCHTLLRGAFLTVDDGGGVGIDPGFDGDHNITWQ